MDELRAGKPVVVGGVTLVPIERCFIQSHSGEMGCWLYGLKEPFAIIVHDATGVRAFDNEANEIPIESLTNKLTQLTGKT